MKMSKAKTPIALAVGILLGLGASNAFADGHMNDVVHIMPQTDPVEKGMEMYAHGEARSGLTYASEETRTLQADDFENPAFLWVEKSEEEWSKVDGDAGKSCQTCHGDVSEMKGVGTQYPKYDPEVDDLLNLEKRINMCRSEGMQATPWKWESDELLGMTALVKMQSRGMPVKVDIEGPAKEYFEKGMEYYNKRVGQMDLACKHCHVDQNGNYMRAELLSQGQANGFPTYRLKWQKLGSLHRRFRGCNNNIRATKLKPGSPEYMALELYVTWRGNGLPVETPSVRK
ncbi:SoxAX cytochrome complex subunit A [Candidatus Terasakiella magnetica]|uniref:SoxAX cytochrome complex subunit A n=1 Tax=Candidatus Terasakiella magnetica TaxID=1867952 RepID=A0A1C3RJJ4_9PROT|nr:sulfur oxidation c-type cytochrome SoxA [Candidatus Terasakiella magnetica]SCA57460.1 SoxAX cytochrome complex subunit A [Candidatus Terasakiella magnetica]